MDSNAGDQCNQRNVSEWDKKLADRFFKHLRREVREKPIDDEQVVLLDLLETYSVDDFMRFLGTDCILRLQEKSQDHRFLCVLIQEIQCGFATASLQCSAQQWTALAAIIADLEEQDSQLVVDTLEKQLPQLQLTSSDLGERWLTWLRIVCLRLLQEDRVQVRCKTLEYFLNHLSVEQLSRLSLLSEFLEATNWSQLFDPEDENCLKEEHLEKFVANGNVELLLEAMVAVSWENVPLLLWIRSFKAEVKSVPKDLFIKLCLVVRGIDNYDYRRGVQVHVMLLFKNTLDGFSLRELMMCMDSMFNKGDSYSYPDHNLLIDKISECIDFEEHMDCFNHRSLDICLYNPWWSCYEAVKLLEVVILKMETLPKTKHCFWRLNLFNTYIDSEVLMDFYRKTYNVDTSLLQEGASLKEMQEHLLEKLECQTREETSFLKARCVDLFTRNLTSWSQLENLNLDPLELMEQGTEEVISILVDCFLNHNERIKDEKVLPALFARYTKIDVLQYKDLPEQEFENCLKNVLHQKKSGFFPSGKLSISIYLKLLAYGEPARELTRIETFYAVNILDVEEPNVENRNSALIDLKMHGTAKTKSKVFKELLRINEELSIEHPEYTENSEVLRQKVRIASALIDMGYDCDDHKCLENLLKPSDHLGINLMHEFLVGKCVKNIDWVLKALPILQPRQQESYLSIAHIFILKNLVKLNVENKLSEMFSLLLPFTMVPCYETRTLAQLILHKLALECELNSIHVPLAEIVINSVETSLGKNLFELQSEPRLLLAEVFLHIPNNFFPFSHFILNMTNVPCDERSKVKYYPYFHEKIQIARQAFRARKLMSSAKFAPSKNIIEENYLKKYYLPSWGRIGYTVVASLLDEKTNFKRFVLICERFGVDSLVVGEESNLEDYNYGSLRIRRVNSASLAGFLKEKEREGYEVRHITKSKLISTIKKWDHCTEGLILVMV